MSYSSDRTFTNYVHNNLAAKIIYPKMDWVIQNVADRLGNNIDINNAVDYMAVDANRRLITIQERFREVRYQAYNDFTIRYMRPENSHEERRESEFFKLDAEFFIYGIINAYKENCTEATGFVKYAVLNLKNLKACIDNGTIIIDCNLFSRTCKKVENKMICPINANIDHSSNFVPFDIVILKDVAPEVIEYQEGFF